LDVIDTLPYVSGTLRRPLPALIPGESAG
jgi:hypothetical protein